MINTLGGSSTENQFILATYDHGNRRYRFYYFLEDGITIHFMPGYTISESDGTSNKSNAAAIPLNIYGYRFRV